MAYRSVNRPLVRFPGFKTLEELAKRRFLRSLPLWLRLYGLDATVIRRSAVSSVPVVDGELDTTRLTAAASSVYGTVSGIGSRTPDQPDAAMPPGEEPVDGEADMLDAIRREAGDALESFEQRAEESEHAEPFDRRVVPAEGDDVTFGARVLASHHVYAPSDPEFITDFEDIYLYTADDIRPRDEVFFVRTSDLSRRSFRVMETESVGTSTVSAYRLLVSPLHSPSEPPSASE